MSVIITDFGRATDGTPVRAATLKNDRIEVQVLSYGAVLRRIVVPDRKGRPVDVALGYDTVPDYELNSSDAMGACVGRFANRIGGAQYAYNGQVYHLTANQKGNCLHSGLHGFHHMVFAMQPTPGTDDSVTLTAVSPDGTDGFPGTVTFEVKVSLTGCGVMLQYAATTDKPTVCNFTNHSYFNLNGHDSGSALGHRLSLNARAFLVIDEASVPTGEKRPVAGTPMDFNEEKTLGRDINADYEQLRFGAGYDHCYLVRDTGLRHAAQLTGPETGITMELLTTLPGVQVYTANYLDPVTPGKDGAAYHPRDAVCLEAQDCPDAPNHPDFPDAWLLPDAPYSATTIYRFGTITL